MAVDTVLRIKRKRNEEPIKVLLTADESKHSAGADTPLSKKRRVWQLSRSSDSRGIPVPLSSDKAVKHGAADVNMKEASPPRFSVRKRKASDTFVARTDQRVLDLERQSAKDDLPQTLSSNEVLSAMVSEYLIGKDVMQSHNTDEDYVYDIYYPSASAQAIAEADAIVRTNYGLLEHFDWDASESLVFEDDEQDSENYDSEDSNAEDWAGNDYPDEEDNNSGDSLEILGSDDERSHDWDEDDWRDD